MINKQMLNVYTRCLELSNEKFLLLLTGFFFFGNYFTDKNDVFFLSSGKFGNRCDKQNILQSNGSEKTNNSSNQDYP